MTEVADEVSIEELVKRMGQWIQRLRQTRLMRRMKVDVSMDPKSLVCRANVSLSDGLVKIPGEPFFFQIADMKSFQQFYLKVEDTIVESFRAMVREKTAPEMVLKGVSPVKVVHAETDGEEIVF